MGAIALTFIGLPAPRCHRHTATEDPPRLANPADTTRCPEGHPAPAHTGARYAQHEQSHPGRAHLLFDPRTQFPRAPAPAAAPSAPDKAHPEACELRHSPASDTASVVPRR